MERSLGLAKSQTRRLKNFAKEFGRTIEGSERELSRTICVGGGQTHEDAEAKRAAYLETHGEEHEDETEAAASTIEAESGVCVD